MKLGDQETVFEHAPKSPTFTVFASEAWSIAMIRRLQKSHPQDVEIVAENADGSLLVRMPFAWMRILPTRRTSEEQRRTARERMTARRSEPQTD